MVQLFEPVPSQKLSCSSFPQEGVCAAGQQCQSAHSTEEARRLFITHRTCHCHGPHLHMLIYVKKGRYLCPAVLSHVVINTTLKVRRVYFSSQVTVYHGGKTGQELKAGF